MQIEHALKTSLDEVRMQMLGVQVLFGFQLQASFQEKFVDLTTIARGMAALALALIVVTLGLLVMPACQHRLVERGEDTQRIYEVVRRCANLALLPLALAIGFSVFVVLTLYFSSTIALAAAALLMLCALVAWYVWGVSLRMSRPGGQLAPRPTDGSGLHGRIEQMLTEARVILPGAQALLGFVHALLCTIATICSTGSFRSAPCSRRECGAPDRSRSDPSSGFSRPGR
jgi:hypothetical protein